MNVCVCKEEKERKRVSTAYACSCRNSYIQHVRVCAGVPWLLKYSFLSNREKLSRGFPALFNPTRVFFPVRAKVQVVQLTHIENVYNFYSSSSWSSAGKVLTQKYFFVLFLPPNGYENVDRKSRCFFYVNKF